MDLTLNSYAIMQKEMETSYRKLKESCFSVRKNYIHFTIQTDIVRTVIFYNILSFLIYGYDGFLLSWFKV